MPEDYLNNSQSNVNAVAPDSTISSQNQNQNPTQNNFNNPNNPRHEEENIGITPFFIFQFLKELIKYFINLPKKFVNAFTDAEKKGKAWREQREAKKAEKEKKKNKRQAKRKQNEQEDITSPSPQSNEFSMFKGKPTTETPGRTEEERIQKSEEAMKQAKKDRQARQAGKKPNGPKRTIKSNPSGK